MRRRSSSWPGGSYTEGAITVHGAPLCRRTPQISPPKKLMANMPTTDPLQISAASAPTGIHIPDASYLSPFLLAPLEPGQASVTVKMQDASLQMCVYLCEDTGIINKQRKLTPSDEYSKPPVTDLSGMEMRELPDEEFKTIVLKMLGGLQKNTDDNLMMPRKQHKNKLRNSTRK